MVVVNFLQHNTIDHMGQTQPDHPVCPVMSLLIDFIDLIFYIENVCIILEN